MYAGNPPAFPAYRRSAPVAHRARCSPGRGRTRAADMPGYACGIRRPHNGAFRELVRMIQVTGRDCAAKLRQSSRTVPQSPMRRRAPVDARRGTTDDPYLAQFPPVADDRDRGTSGAAVRLFRLPRAPRTGGGRDPCRDRAAPGGCEPRGAGRASRGRVGVADHGALQRPASAGFRAMLGHRRAPARVAGRFRKHRRRAARRGDLLQREADERPGDGDRSRLVPHFSRQ